MAQQTQIDQLSRDLQPRKFGTAGVIWTIVLCVAVINGLVAYYDQLENGLEITAMNDVISWGIYISNFVFFVAVSLVGSLISAILRLTNATWSKPLTRIAEIIAVSNIIFAGLIIIVDMGRPERAYFLFLHGRIQSPIVWDVMVVSTYLVISVLFLLIPMIPDMAILKEKMTNIPKWQKKMYLFLSFKWAGTAEQVKMVHRSMRILTILIIPVALGIHTVTAWLFASTMRPGWNSTNFGPYFVSGAFMVGAAAVIAVMYVARRFYHTEKYLTHEIFDRMGKLLVLLSLVYFYFNINEYLTPAFKMEGEERGLIQDLFIGDFAPIFWSVQIFGIALPIILLLFKWGRKPLPLFVIANVVIVGAWFKRFLIVIPTLFHPLVPLTEGGTYEMIHYYPTFEEWSITIGSLAGSLLIITILFRYFPFIGIWELAEKETKHKTADDKIYHTSPKVANT